MIRQYPESVLNAYSQKGKDAALSVSASKQIAIFNVRAFNNSGSTLSVGILRKINTGAFKVFKSVAAAITDISTVGAGQNIFTVTNNDGFYVQSSRKIGLIGMTVGTAQAGGVFTFTYWNGSSFATLTTIENPADYSATGDKYIVFRAPYDWATGDGGVTGLDTSMYTIRVRGTTGPAGTVVATAYWFGEFLDLYGGVVDKAAVQISFPDSKPFLLNGTESLFPYFSTAHAANSFAAYYAPI